MGPYLIIGLLLGLLLAALIVVGVMVYLFRDRDSVWRLRLREESDARKATELRSAAQIDAMLDRINTSPRLEMATATGNVDPEERTYFSDAPHDDADWNEFVGETSEDEE